MEKGIDVSTYQGKIDWSRVRRAGYTFAMVKATQGRSETKPTLRNFTDSRFTENFEGARQAGLSCGVYHYLTAQTAAEAKTEAALFLSVIGTYPKETVMYAAVDVESKYLPTDKAALTTVTDTFCSAVERAGYRSMIYTNPDFLKNRLNDIGDRRLWLALWRDVGLLPSKADYPTLTIWQWGTEQVDGVTDPVDSNLCFSDTTTAAFYADEVCRRAGLAKETRVYLEKYTYTEDLFRKLYFAMEE